MSGTQSSHQCAAARPVIGTHNPFNNLWTESPEDLIQSEQFAKKALKTIAAKKRVIRHEKQRLGKLRAEHIDQ